MYQSKPCSSLLCRLRPDKILCIQTHEKTIATIETRLNKSMNNFLWLCSNMFSKVVPVYFKAADVSVISQTAAWGQGLKRKCPDKARDGSFLSNLKLQCSVNSMWCMSERVVKPRLFISRGNTPTVLTMFPQIDPGSHWGLLSVSGGRKV